MTGEISATTAPVVVKEAEEAPAIAPPVFDLSKKKKKKKPKTTTGESTAANGRAAVETITDGAGNIKLADGSDPLMDDGQMNDQPVDFPQPDFTGKKKRRKKKVFFEDDVDGELGDAGGDEGQSERVSRRDVAPQPWDDTDRDYTYPELINRAFQFLHGKNPALASGGSRRKKVSLQLPQVAREGTKKTVFLNFGSICKSIHRQQDHLLAYMSAELGTTGNIQDGGRLVIKGRFGAEGIANVLKRYMLEYVICTSCRSPDTVLMRDANTRLYFVSCESCGAKRSVAAIRQGFMAQVERRKRK